MIHRRFASPDGVTTAWTCARAEANGAMRIIDLRAMLDAVVYIGSIESLW